MTQNPTRPPWTVSEIQTFDTCPEMWRLRYRQKLQAEESTALRLGTAVHTWLAQKMLDQTPVPLTSLDLEPEDMTQAETLQLALDKWGTTKPPWTEVMMVEEPLQITYGGLVFLGKPDAVVKWHDRWWHVQHKTVAGTMPIPTFVRAIQHSLHEGLYCTMLERYGRVGGTMLNIVRKLSRKTVEKNPSQALHLEFIPITTEMRVGVLRDLLLRGKEIELLDKQPGPLYRNRAACNGRFGNSRCPYYGVCWEGQREEELQHADPLARYNEGDV